MSREETVTTVRLYEECKLKLYGSTFIGTREYQQDRMLMYEGKGISVAAVCDGMGGMESGERASQLAVDVLTADMAKLEQAEDISAFLREEASKINELVADFKDEEGSPIESGSTIVMIVVKGDLTAHENSVKYFERYNKLKRTYEALSKLTLETKEEIDHLESISNSLDIAVSYDDLVQLKEEMIEYGYIHRKGAKSKAGSNRKEKITSKPFHYISSDGFHMYVGKNNYQNEELTFKLATGNDWWFHAKNIPGSHVIVKADNKELPDNTFEEAARLAAHYSKANGQEKVDVDYIQKKHIKKPAAAKPGFVIYHTNYSMTIDNDAHKMGTLVEE